MHNKSFSKFWCNCTIFISLFCYSCNDSGIMNENPITLQATFMQYACGDDNDDMRITQVNDSDLKFLIGKDIDPLLMNGASEIRGWLYDNKTEKYNMEYRLTGYISKDAKHGCDKKASKFWITKIEKLDGSAFDISGE